MVRYQEVSSLIQINRFMHRRDLERPVEKKAASGASTLGLTKTNGIARVASPYLRCIPLEPCPTVAAFRRGARTLLPRWSYAPSSRARARQRTRYPANFFGTIIRSRELTSGSPICPFELVRFQAALSQPRIGDRKSVV